MTEAQLKEANNLDNQIQKLIRHKAGIEEQIERAKKCDSTIMPLINWRFFLHTARGEDWDDEFDIDVTLFAESMGSFLSAYLQMIQARIKNLQTAFSQL